MAEPARRNAEAPAQGDPERQPGPPAALAWEALIVSSEAVAKAAAEVAARPGDQAALDMLDLTLKVQLRLGAMAGRSTVDAGVIETVRARARQEGYEACKAERCRMQVIDGGREG